jgi:hypothetical protein
MAAVGCSALSLKNSQIASRGAVIRSPAFFKEVINNVFGVLIDVFSI